MQIHFAARNGDLETVERQLRQGVSVNEPDPREGRTPLMYACDTSVDNSTMLRILIEHGASVDSVSKSLSYTPLMIAAQRGGVEHVRLLLSRDADATYVNSSGYNAMLMAIWKDSPTRIAIINLLAEAGADPNAMSSFGESPLKSAVRTGATRSVERLLDAGADPSRLGWHDIHNSVLRNNQFTGTQGASDVNFLDTSDDFGFTPLLMAISLGKVDFAQALVERGVSLKRRGRCDQTPLMHAVRGDHLTMVNWLLKSGCDPAESDEFGGTALMEAASYSSQQACQALLSAGADVHQCNHLGSRAISSAANIDLVRILVDAGADLNEVDAGYGLLKMAAERGDESFVRDLLALGAEADVTSTGDTALHTAVLHDHVNIVRMLIGAGANVNAQDVDGWTPLMFVRSVASLKQLLAAGADRSITDQCGNRAAENVDDGELRNLL